ncbi:hypothetical protein K8I28_07560 [bacterium]|nr:hypothetical protein [bacterium]
MLLRGLLFTVILLMIILLVWLTSNMFTLSVDKADSQENISFLIRDSIERSYNQKKAGQIPEYSTDTSNVNIWHHRYDLITDTISTQFLTHELYIDLGNFRVKNCDMEEIQQLANELGQPLFYYKLNTVRIHSNEAYVHIEYTFLTPEDKYHWTYGTLRGTAITFHYLWDGTNWRQDGKEIQILPSNSFH